MTELSFAMVARGLYVTAMVNGFEVAQTADLRPRATRVDVRSFLVAGENTLQVFAELGPGTAPPSGTDGGPLLDCGFYLAAIDEPTHAGNMLVGALVDPSVIKVSDAGPTRILAHSVKLDKALARWHFDRAEPWSQERLPAAEALVASVRDALERKDLRALTRLYSIRITESGLAARRDRDEAEADFVSEWADLMSEGEIHTSDVPITFQAALLGKVAHARGPGGRSPIVAKTPSGMRGLAMSIAVIDGVPRIVR